MSELKKQKSDKIQKLSERQITLVDEAYSPKKLPEGMPEPKLRGFLGHQQPEDLRPDPSEPSDSASASERSSKPETARPSTIPADQEQ